MALGNKRPVARDGSMPPSYRSLSSQLLMITIALVVLGSVTIHLLSLARYREEHLTERLNNGYLVTLAVQESIITPNPALASRLLESVDAQGIEVNRLGSDRPLSLGNVQVADLYVDLPLLVAPVYAVQEAIYTLLTGGRRLLAVTGNPRQQPTVWVTLFIDERTLYREMLAYSRQTLLTITGTALVAGLLVYLGLQWFLVQAISRITRNLVEFRQDPSDPGRVIRPSRRFDEIGVMERELARMQSSLREALAQQSRLAALGIAVSKINHDLRSILSTVSITSAQLAQVDNPGVHRILPLLSDSVQRAIQLCTLTLDLARGDRQTPQRGPCGLGDLVTSVATALKLQDGPVRWHNQVADDLVIDADRDRLYRILFNLIQNAVEAMGEQGGDLHIRARPHQQDILIEIQDTGPGIPDSLRETLFTPFASARPGGTGLGLATARDLARSHGGELSLARSGPQGSCFHLYLPGES